MSRPTPTPASVAGDGLVGRGGAMTGPPVGWFRGGRGVVMSGNKLCESAWPGHTGPREGSGGLLSLSPVRAGGDDRAKEATVSRAKARTGGWRVAVLLVGALTQLVGGQ